MPPVTRKRPTAKATASKRTVAKSTTSKPAAKRTPAKAAVKSRQPSSTTVARGVAKSQKTRAAKPVPEYLPMKPRDIVRRIKAGESFGEVAPDYGSLQKVRTALAEFGYDTKGQKFAVEPIKGSGVALAKRIARAREANRPWYELEIATGKTQVALKELLVANGYAHLTEGRIRKDGSPTGNVNGKGTTGPSKATTRVNRARAAAANASTAKTPTKTTPTKTTPTKTTAKAPVKRGRPAKVAEAPAPKRTRKVATGTAVKVAAPKTASKSPARARTRPAAAKSNVTPIATAKRGPKRVSRRKVAAADPSVAA
jgi:uncharacterized protein (DUF433 family)